MKFGLRPIGIIHTPFTKKQGTPIQSSRSQEAGEVQVYPEYLEGLQDLDGFSHIILLYVFHKSTTFSLMVKPFLDAHERGLFARRFPARPNPIGISIVRLRQVQDNTLSVEGIDVLDGTLLLDIKPYMPDFDVCLETDTSWYATRSFQ